MQAAVGERWDGGKLEDIAAYAHTQGFEASVEDINAYYANDDLELTNFELELVAGGVSCFNT